MDKNDLKCVFQFELNGKKYTGSLSGSFKELVMTDGSCAGCKHNDPDNTWCFYFNDHAFSGKNCEHFEEGRCRECKYFSGLVANWCRKHNSDIKNNQTGCRWFERS